MATVYPSAFGPSFQWENTAGEPAVGDKVFFYLAGSNTKINTYTNSTGNVANPNPIILNALGMPPNEVWWTSGVLYKVVWAPSTDTDPPTSPIRTWDNLSGINDIASLAVDEWQIYGAPATFISATSFSVTGNQTGIFQPGRRVKTINAGGTVYSTILTSVFGANTVVTLSNDSGVLDSGLSSVAYGILSVNNPSYPNFIDSVFRVVDDGDKTKRVAFDASLVSTATTKTLTVQDKSGTIALTTDAVGLQSITSTQAGGAITSSFSGGILAFRSGTSTLGTINTVSIPSNNGTIPSGATLGAITTIAARILILEYYNGGTPVLGWVNISGGNQVDETNLVSPTTISAGSTSANVFYSASAVAASSPYRVIGFFDAVNTAGAWGNPTLVQAAGGQALTALSSVGYGQTWQVVTRSSGTTYYNTTGKPIELNASIVCNGVGLGTISLTIDGVAINVASSGASGVNAIGSGSVIIQPGKSYLVTVTNASSAAFNELR